MAGRPGIGVRNILSRTPDSYWSSWLVSLPSGYPMKRCTRVQLMNAMNGVGKTIDKWLEIDAVMSKDITKKQLLGTKWS